MKKIFTLFIATVVAMSMMALPQNVIKAGKSKPASQKVETKAHVKAMELAKEKVALREFVRPESEKKVAPAAPAKAPKKVANAQTEVINLHFDAFSVEPEYYAETGDWYMACSNAEGYIVKFDIYAPEDSYCGTFTTEDFDLYYSYIYTPDDYVEYVSIECTISKEEVSQYLTEIHLSAVIEGTDGNTYNVTCVHRYLSPKETVNHDVIADATLAFDGVEFVLAGKNDVLDVNLAVAATWPTGRFTQGEFNMDETSIVYNGVEQELMNAEVSLEVVADEAGNPGYAADLTFYNQDTVLHNVSMVAPLPAANDTIEITMHNLNVDDSWAMIFGWVYLTAVDADWDIYAGVYAMQAEEGTWKGGETMLYITPTTTYEELEAIYAEITMTETENGWAVVAKGYCDDGNYYIVNMDFVVPEPTEFVTLSFENTAKATFYPDLGNDLLLANADDQYEVGIDIYGVGMGETFTYDNMDATYSYLIDNGEEVQIGAVEGIVYQVGDTTKMDAKVVGFNGVEYTVNLWYAVPTPTETVEVTVEDAEFVNAIADQGVYQLHGYVDNGLDYVSLAVYADEVAGTYVNDGVFGRFGAEGGRYDLYPNYNYIVKIIDPETEEFEQYTVEKGTINVTVDENNVITAVADVICSNAVNYVITVTSEYHNHLQYDAEESLEVYYTAEDLLNVEYDATNEGVWVDVYAADYSNITQLFFFVEETDDELLLPVGEYTIDNSMDYGTVMASIGVDASGSIYPSFYGNFTEDGSIEAPLWFMVGGTVNVQHVDGQLYIEVNAVNSYDYDVHITYDPNAGGSVGELYYDVITNMSIDLDNMVIYGGPSNEFGVEVVLGLAEDNMDGSFTLSQDSYVTILNGEEVTFIDGIAYEIDAYAPSALVDLVVDWNGTILQFHLEMSAVTNEAVVIEVYDAKVEIGQVELFDGVYDYTLTMTADWTDADGVTYPVLVEVPVYYPEATEPYDMMATVTVGGWADEDPWLGFGEGYVTVSTVDGVVTVQGLIENPGTGFAADITIAGKLETTALENVTTATFEKVLKNGQLIIIKNGVEYNAQGAIVK